MLRKNGIPIWCRLTASAVMDSNREPMFLVGMVEDISKRLEAEQATRQSGEFAEAVCGSSGNAARD